MPGFSHIFGGGSDFMRSAQAFKNQKIETVEITVV